jgi:serine O-acetyltransferase
MLNQISYLKKDIIKNLGRNKFRIFIFVISPIFWGILQYRFERLLYQLLDTKYKYFRVFISPFLFIIESYSKMDIHYLANIKGGLRILHNTNGVVISGQSIIGENLILVGGNFIGAKSKGEIIIGNNCTLGANATIIGPLVLGNNISIGASACVVKSCLEDNIILIGVPAKVMKL